MKCKRTSRNILKIHIYSSNWCHHTCFREMLQKGMWEISRNTLLLPYALWNLASPFYLWDRLLPQVTMTLNMLWRSWIYPGLSAYEQVDGIHSFEQTTLAPLVCKVQIHEKLHNRLTYAPHSAYGWYRVLGELLMRSVERTIEKEITRIENGRHDNDKLDSVTL